MPAVIESLRAMPPGVRVFLVYALLILAVIGIAMPSIIDQTGDISPVSLPGLVAMALLAFTIFTVTLVLQRKQAAYLLALTLASLTIPAIPLAWITLSGYASRLPFTAILVAIAALLFGGLTRPSTRTYLSEP